MLYTVTRDLEKMRHLSGAYLEWDDDYSAACSKQENGECSLLARNGDPVCDLLYSNNWVPLGLMQAYFVTEDAFFYDLFCRHAAERAKESGTEQNYNMIDGCVNNNPKKPRIIGNRISVLDRLHIKLEERKQKSQPQQQQQQERSRKN